MNIPRHNCSPVTSFISILPASSLLVQSLPLRHVTLKLSFILFRSSSPLLPKLRFFLPRYIEHIFRACPSSIHIYYDSFNFPMRFDKITFYSTEPLLLSPFTTPFVAREQPRNLHRSSVTALRSCDGAKKRPSLYCLTTCAVIVMVLHCIDCRYRTVPLAPDLLNQRSQLMLHCTAQRLGPASPYTHTHTHTHCAAQCNTSCSKVLPYSTGA